MEFGARGEAGLKVLPRLKIFTLVVGAVFYYFFFREAYCPPHITGVEQLFLLCYALLSAGCFTFAQLRWQQKKILWPRLDTWWKRFLLYFALAGSLTVILAALPLPEFYGRVLQHTIFLPFVPFFIDGRKNWLDSITTCPDCAPDFVSSTQGELTLSISPKKALILIALALVFVVAGFLMLHDHLSVVGWTTIGFFGLGIPVGVAMLIPGSSCLILRQDDFVMRHTWRNYAFRWNEVTDFVVVNGLQGPRVAWNVLRSDFRRSSLVRETYNRDAFLVDNYGLSARELCAMMIARRAAALDRAA